LPPYGPDRVSQVVPAAGEHPAGRRSGRRNRPAGLREAPHALAKSARLVQLAERHAPRVGAGCSGRAQLLAPIVEMLRQLLDDLGFPCTAQAQAGQPAAEIVRPVTPRLYPG
jgi:hypothetical protein